MPSDDPHKRRSGDGDSDDLPRKKRPRDDEDEEEDRPRKKRPREAEEEEDDRPRKKRPRDDDEEEEDDRPRKKPPRDDDEEEEDDRPRKKRPRDDDVDEEEDEAPRRKRKKKKSKAINTGLLIGLIVGGAVAVLGLVLLVVFFVMGGSDKPITKENLIGKWTSNENSKAYLEFTGDKVTMGETTLGFTWTLPYALDGDKVEIVIIKGAPQPQVQGKDSRRHTHAHRTGCRSGQ